MGTTKKILFNSPVGLAIDTTILCNSKCSFCWRKTNHTYLEKLLMQYKSASSSMNFQMYKKIIDDAVQYEHIRWFSLCGPMGEPLMHKQIADFYEYANMKNHFNSLNLNTNGTILPEKNIPKLLNNTTKFGVSIDSIDLDTYAKIHGNKNFFPLVIDNLKKLIAYKKQYGAKANIIVRFTECEENFGQYPEFEKYFMDLGVDQINYTKLHGFCGLHKELNSTYGAQKCNQILNVLNFNFKGELTTCCVNWKLEPTFGSIKDYSLDELWYNEKMKNWLDNRLETPPCNECGGVGAHVQKTNLHNKKTEILVRQ